MNDLPAAAQQQFRELLAVLGEDVEFRVLLDEVLDMGKSSFTTGPGSSLVTNIRAVCVWETGRQHTNSNREILTSRLWAHATYYGSLYKSVHGDNTVLARFIDQCSLEKDFLRIQESDSTLAGSIHSLKILTLSHH